MSPQKTRLCLVHLILVVVKAYRSLSQQYPSSQLYMLANSKLHNRNHFQA